MNVRAFIDSQGQLRFSTPEGVLIWHYSTQMLELQQAVDCAHSDSGLVELVDGYEGTVSGLYDLVTKQWYLVKDSLSEYVAQKQPTSKPKDPRRRLIARMSARHHASTRNQAARQSAISAKGKSAHKAVGRLNARIGRRS